MRTPRIAKILLAFLLLLASAGRALAADLSIALPASIEAREGSFHLGEYAEIEGERGLADAASMALLSPRDGGLTRDDVVRALGTTGAAGRDVAIRMPDAVRVLPESRIAEELRAITAWKWRIDVQGIQVDDRTDFSLPPRIAPGARTVTVKLNDENGKTGKSVSKGLKLTWYQPVVYSVKPLARDGSFSMPDLRMRVDDVGMAVNCVWSSDQIRHSKARQSIGAYKAISFEDVEQVMAVKRGSTVTMVAKANGLGIEMQGIAMQRGGIGDVIKVRNLSSKKILSGVIVDVGRVEIR